jgi:large subunit ribosomal protein L17
MGASARKSLLRNLVTSLLKHGKIKTTEAKAKELRGFVDKVITIAKRAPDAASAKEDQKAGAARVHAIRQARLWVLDDDAMKRLFDDYATGFSARPGGYTRVVKCGFRPGDNAPMAFIEVVERG